MYIDAKNDQGGTFFASESGLYRFTIIGGAFSPHPTDDFDSYWANSIHIFNNTPIRWDLNGGPGFDYYLGDGIKYPSGYAAETAGIGQFVDIPMDAGNYVTLILPGAQDQYSNHRGGITVSVNWDPSLPVLS